MVDYQRYVELSQSSNSEDRGSAAHLSALAYLGHDGPADEQAALYAALMAFLDDPSVKVRAALAYGLLHSPHAPRPIMLALAQDAPVISRAVIQFSPVLLDADLIGLVRSGDPAVLAVMTARETLSPRVALALIAHNDLDVTVRVLHRPDIPLPSETLLDLAERLGDDAPVRGALLARDDLPGIARRHLIDKVTTALSAIRLVKGSIQPRRLSRLMQNACDRATAAIGEREARNGDRAFSAALVSADLVNTRLMLHALVHGQTKFFASCLADLAEAPRTKVFSILETGNRAALHAVFSRCGFAPAVRNLLARMVMHARSADLADDIAARHFIVTLMIEELIVEHEGDIPAPLTEAFAYLNEQNIALARLAARGVMPAFADESPDVVMLPEPERQLALPAA